MPTPDPAVDAYLSHVTGPRRDAVVRLRELCLEHLPGFTEGVKYGMPGYWRGPVAEGEGEIGSPRRSSTCRSTSSAPTSWPRTGTAWSG